MKILNPKSEIRNKFNFGCRASCFVLPAKRGYTLVELIVALGLFTLVMLLASGAYLFMIGLNRQAQGVATGIDSLSFALETMTRTIRTGYGYSCDNCFPSPGNSLSFTSSGGERTITYARGTQEGPSGIVGSIVETNTGAILTDPSVDVTSLAFYVTGEKNASSPPDDFQQPHVTIVVSGTVTYEAGKSEAFNVQTGATMRGPDISSSTIDEPEVPESPADTYIVEGKYDNNGPGDNGQLYSWDYADSSNISTGQLHDGNTSSGGVTGNDRMIAVRLNQPLPSSRNFILYGNWGSRFSVGYSTNGSSWTTAYYGRESSPYTFNVPAGAQYIAAAIEQGNKWIYEIADTVGSSQPQSQPEVGPASQTTDPYSQTYGWYTRSGGSQSTPYSGVRQTVIRWNGTTIYDGSATEPVTSGGYTYTPDTYQGSIYGWSSDYSNAFDVIREGGSSGSQGSSGSMTISPAVSGKTSWNFSTDGPLNLGAAGTWTITPSGSLGITAKIWGGGGGGDSRGSASGGGAGYTTGSITLTGGNSYVIVVGGGGSAGVASSGTYAGGFPGAGGNGYGNNSYGSGGGGGYSGIFASSVSQSNARMIAGGGGGAGFDPAPGGAGGGSSGLEGPGSSSRNGDGGTQSSGGAGGGGASDGSALSGGNGQSDNGAGGGGGYYGGGGGQSGVGGSGGGGSGYYHSSVSGGSTTAGSGATPGNSGDSNRGNSGTGGASQSAGQTGRVYISGT